MSQIMDTRGEAWTVFRAGPEQTENVVVSVIVSVIGLCFLVPGVLYESGVRFGGVRDETSSGLWLLGFGLVPLVLVNLVIWGYYVAIDERHVAAGRMRGRAREIVERRDIAYVAWVNGAKSKHGALCATDGSSLLDVESWISRAQIVGIAEVLGVPLREVGGAPDRV